MALVVVSPTAEYPEYTYEANRNSAVDAARLVTEVETALGIVLTGEKQIGYVLTSTRIRTGTVTVQVCIRAASGPLSEAQQTALENAIASHVA